MGYSVRLSGQQLFNFRSEAHILYELGQLGNAT